MFKGRRTNAPGPTQRFATLHRIPKSGVNALTVVAFGLMTGLFVQALNGDHDKRDMTPNAFADGVDLPTLAPQHEEMDFDMAVAITNESEYIRSGNIELVTLTSTDFSGSGQTLVTHQLANDAGKAVSAPVLGELKDRLAKKQNSTEKTVLRKPLRDGYYKVRSIGVGASEASDGVGQAESYFLVQDGELYAVDANQWFENSIANRARGG